MCSCGCLCVCMCVQARDQLPALFLRHHTPCVLKQSLIPGPGPYQLASPRGLTFFLHCAGLTNAHYHNWLFVLHMNWIEARSWAYKANSSSSSKPSLPPNCFLFACLFLRKWFTIFPDRKLPLLESTTLLSQSFVWDYSLVEFSSYNYTTSINRLGANIKDPVPMEGRGLCKWSVHCEHQSARKEDGP